MKKLLAVLLACLTAFTSALALAEATAEPHATASPEGALNEYTIDKPSFEAAEQTVAKTGYVYSVPADWTAQTLTRDEQKGGTLARWLSADGTEELTVMLETLPDAEDLNALSARVGAWTGYSEEQLVTINGATVIRYLRRPASSVCILAVLDAEAGACLHFDLRTDAIDGAAYTLVAEIASTLREAKK